MDALFEAEFSPLSDSGRGLSKCGKCLQYMKLISSQPSRLYCGTCEEIYYAPQKGTVKQKVYVKGGKKEEAVELEVYNQGMIKTELCNKWQQTGACPYGENCQFAHGVAELRPVLRHPRYKTEVCRMVLNGTPCPYGHRCHFHHSLTQQVQLIKAMNNSRQPIKYR